MALSVSDGVDEGVEVECGQIGVLGLDENDRRGVVLGQVHVVGHAVVEIGKSYLVLCTQWVSDDDFVHIIELIPILVT